MRSSVARYREARLSEFGVPWALCGERVRVLAEAAPYPCGVAATNSSTASPAALIPAASDALTGDS